MNEPAGNAVPVHLAILFALALAVFAAASYFEYFLRLADARVVVIAAPERVAADETFAMELRAYNRKNGAPWPGRAVLTGVYGPDSAWRPDEPIRVDFDADGLARIHAIAPSGVPGKSGMYVVQVENPDGGDRERFSGTFDFLPAPPAIPPPLFVATDCQAYRPGRTVSYAAFVMRPGSLKPIGGETVVVSLFDAQGGLVEKRESRTSAGGVAAGEFELAAAATPGSWRIGVKSVVGETERGFSVGTDMDPVLPPLRQAEDEQVRVAILPEDGFVGEDRSNRFLLAAWWENGIPVRERIHLQRGSLADGGVEEMFFVDLDENGWAAFELPRRNGPFVLRSELSDGRETGLFFFAPRPGVRFDIDPTPRRPGDVIEGEMFLEGISSTGIVAAELELRAPAGGSHAVGLKQSGAGGRRFRAIVPEDARGAAYLRGGFDLGGGKAFFRTVAAPVAAPEPRLTAGYLLDARGRAALSLWQEREGRGVEDRRPASGEAWAFVAFIDENATASSRALIREVENFMAAQTPGAGLPPPLAKAQAGGELPFMAWGSGQEGAAITTNAVRLDEADAIAAAGLRSWIVSAYIALLLGWLGMRATEFLNRRYASCSFSWLQFCLAGLLLLVFWPATGSDAGFAGLRYFRLVAAGPREIAEAFAGMSKEKDGGGANGSVGGDSSIVLRAAPALHRIGDSGTAAISLSGDGREGVLLTAVAISKEGGLCAIGRTYGRVAEAVVEPPEKKE